MGMETTIIPDRIDASAVDGTTITLDSDDNLTIHPNLLKQNAEQEIEIIELQANAGVTDIDHNTLISETFSDSDGFNDSVNTGNTTATFSTNKYTRVPVLSDSNVRFYYQFEADGTDLAGNNNLTLVNTPTFGAGKLNNGMTTVAGSTQYAHASALVGQENVRTIEMWIKPTANINNQTFMCIFQNTSNYLIIHDDNSGSNKLKVANTDTGGNNWTLVSTTSLSAGTWMHVVVVMGTGGAKLYINGNTTPEDTDVATDVIPAGWDTINIGRYQNGTAYASAQFDNIIMSDAQYSTANVTTAYNSGSGRELTSLGGGTVEIDLPTITGTVTNTMLVIKDPDRETGDSIVYEVEDASTNTDTSLSVDTKNAITNLTGNPSKLRIVLGAGTSETSGVPSVKSFALKLWKSA